MLRLQDYRLKDMFQMYYKYVTMKETPPGQLRLRRSDCRPQAKKSLKRVDIFL